MTTYTPSLRLWEGTPGDPAIRNQWGTALNENDNLIESALVGQASVNLTGLTTYTLTTANGADDQARPLVQAYSGALTGDCTVTLPNVPKAGYAQNNTTGTHNVILAAGSGSRITIPPNGQWYLFYADGTGDLVLPVIGNGGGGGGGGGSTLIVTDGVHTVANTSTLLFAGATVGGSSGTATVTVTGGGGGGGGTLEITDGTHTVNNATSLTVSGATVGGSGSAATLTITGGGGGGGLPTNNIGTTVSGSYNVRMLAGTPTSSALLQFTDTSGAQTGYVGASVGTNLVLGIGGAFTGWVVGGNFSVYGTATINGPILPYNVTITATGQFAQSSGARINRLNDRVLIGAATANDGNVPSTTNDWLCAAVPLTTDLAQGISLSTIGGFGFIGGSQSVNNATAGSLGTIGLGGYALNNNTATIQTVYAAYFEARHMTGIKPTSITQGIECDVANLVNTVVSLQPYQIEIGGMTPNIWSASGAGLSGAHTASLAYAIINNGAAFDKGILFQSNSIAGTDGVTGAGTAIGFAKGQAQVWYNNAGSQIATINASTVNAADAMSLEFLDSGIQLGNGTGQAQVVIPHVTNPANYLLIEAAAAGTGVLVQATGTDTNVALTLSPKNAGLVGVIGNFAPTADNSYNLGLSSNRWSEVWAFNGSIQTSDPRLKTDAQPLPESLPIVMALSPTLWRWIDGGKKPVTSTVERLVHDTEEVTEEVEDHEVQPDGAVHLVKRTVTRSVPLYDRVPVVNPDGTPVMDRVKIPQPKHPERQPDGSVKMIEPEARYEMRQREHPRPRMKRISEEVTDMVSQPGKRIHAGFMAPEVKAVMEQYVPDFAGYVMGADGTEHLRPTYMIPFLCKAIQELASKVAALEAKGA